MMDKDQIERVLTECARFQAKARILLEALKADEKRVADERATGREYSYSNHFPKETGALRRASMDLTRELAQLRKY
jgi:hypothetical protein